DFEEGFFESLHTAYEVGWPKPRVLVISFPHNPTGASVDLAFMQRVVDFCRERGMIVVHDFAYADVGFNGVRPPSILQAEGAREVAVEQYSMTKSFSMAGWRSAFMVGNSEVVQALVKLKSYLDYGMFQPVQIAATVVFREEPDYPKEICSIYESRCDTLIDGLSKIGWDVPKPGGTMFVWAPIPEPYREMDSVEFCSMLVRECDVALSPGVGFGPGGEGFVRFALIENEQRITQAMRNLKRGLTKLG
ncbi:MAG: aminotransferase class I/II-fold pyridoxal phosphate-dependent enzyme, partial [Ilumatobacteraceae bacterium]